MRKENTPEPTTTFSTSQLHEIDLELINVLLTQAKLDPEAVIRACKFVLEKLKDEL